MNWIVTLCAIAVLVLGCWLVGRALEKRWGLDPARETPAQDCFDGKDYVPTPKIVVLGHHFSSIAGAGTIVGAVIASSYGWLPALLWIVVGGLLFGAAHDFGALFASLRHKGRSLGFVLREHAGEKAQRLFTVFALLVLALLVACFTNVVANAFASEGTGVLSVGLGQVSAQASAGTAAILFVLVALLFGLLVFRKNLPMLPVTVMCLLLMAGSVAAGLYFGLNLPYAVWVALIAVYIVAASLAPVWSLLQPRDFLSAFLLWGMMLYCLVVLLLPHELSAPLPAVDFHGQNPGYAILSVLVMGGAVSGCSALIASGTTAKQLANEKHARGVSVGSVALNAVLAVIVLLAMNNVNLTDTALASPLSGFATGVANAAGSPLAYSLVLLTCSVFALTTLDTCTRLARYLFGELFNPDNRRIAKLEGAQKFFARPAVGTLILVLLGCGLGLVRDLNRLWPLFGAANLLLAGHALHTVVIFLRKEKKSDFLPLIGMGAAMAAGMGFLLVNAVRTAVNAADWIDWLVVGVSVVLAVLSFLLVYARPGKPEEAASDAD